MLTDSYNRKIRDLRISLTDRCNYRCFYCLPNGEPPLARKETLLTFEEIARLGKIFVSLGIEKLRLTGGEPLIRRDVDRLVSMLSELKPGLKDIALTTNGTGFRKHALRLREAGLDRVTLSLDSLDRDNFRDITGIDDLPNVLDAIDAAREFGFDRVKINAVIVRGRNEHELVDFAAFARDHSLSFRFIEFMPLDSGHEWDRRLVVPGREIVETIGKVFPLELASKSRGSETAWIYRFADGSSGELGIIAPVTEMFCGACSRIRLTADGQIRTCLFSTTEHDLRGPMRSGATDGELIELIREIVLNKEPRHYINDPTFVPASRTMSFIGG